MWVRSCAIVKIVGACSDAATVCPTSTLRATTIPSTGDRMIVYARLVFATATAASACVTCAFACVTPATAARHAGDRAIIVRLREIQHLLRLDAVAHEQHVPVVVRLGLHHRRLRLLDGGLGGDDVRLRGLEVGRRLLQRALEQRRFDQSRRRRLCALAN